MERRKKNPPVSSINSFLREAFQPLLVRERKLKRRDAKMIDREEAAERQKGSQAEDQRPKTNCSTFFGM